MNATSYALLAALSLSTGCLAFDDDPDVAAAQSGLTQSDLTDQVPWVIHIQAGNKGCTGTVLSSHWILTAAHCANVSQSTQIDISLDGLPASPGGPVPRTHLYTGAAHYYPNPSWDPTAYVDTDADDDIAVIHLLGAAGINLSRTGQAKLFFDTREPYHDNYPNRYFHQIGYGRGTDVGGSSDCDDGVSRGKRIGYGFQVHVSSDSYQAHAGFDGTHPCPGDSGGPWLFARGPVGAKVDMQFGVMSSMTSSIFLDRMWAALVPPRKSFIETRAAGTTHPLTCNTHFAGDWRYLRCDEPAVPIDPGPIVVFPATSPLQPAPTAP